METKHVSILVMRGTLSLVNVEGAHQILKGVNEVIASSGKRPLYEVHLVGLNHEGQDTSSLFNVRPDCLIGEVARTDLILIPAIHDERSLMIGRNAAFIPWIIDQYRKGAEIASLCVGAFFLAATGLLDGKKCSTHPAEADHFRRMYPHILLVDEKIVTEDTGVYTSGGGYSFLNLLLYLIGKHAGREVALAVAKDFAIDTGRTSQSHFAIFRGQHDHKDEVVRAVQDYIESNWRVPMSVSQIADRAALGRRSLERRFRTATGNSVSEYVLRVKIEAAKSRLESGKKTVLEVMNEVGYMDHGSFRNAFKKITGLTPMEYKNRYNSLF